MKRVISAAVAVAAFGFAAAICVPAQAQSQGRRVRGDDQGRWRGRDVLGGGETVDALSVTNGGLVDGRAVPGGLDGSNRQTGVQSTQTDLHGLASAWEASANWDLLGGLPDGTSTDGIEGLLMTVSEAVEEFVDASADNLAPADNLVSVGDSQAGVGIGSEAPPNDLEGLRDLARLMGSPDLPDGPGGSGGIGDLDVASPLTSTRALRRAAGTSPEDPEPTGWWGGIGGLLDVVNRAVPRGGERADTVAPLVGTVFPVEAAPVVRTAAPLVRSVSRDEVSPPLGNTAEDADAVTGGETSRR